MALQAPATVRKLGTRGPGRDKLFRTTGNTPHRPIVLGTRTP